MSKIENQVGRSAETLIERFRECASKQRRNRFDYAATMVSCAEAVNLLAYIDALRPAPPAADDPSRPCEAVELRASESLRAKTDAGAYIFVDGEPAGYAGPGGAIVDLLNGADLEVCRHDAHPITAHRNWAGFDPAFRAFRDRIRAEREAQRAAAKPAAEAWHAKVTSENALRVRINGSGWSDVTSVRDAKLWFWSRSGECYEGVDLTKTRTGLEVQLIDGTIVSPA